MQRTAWLTAAFCLPILVSVATCADDEPVNADQYTADERSHWAYLPVTDQDVPTFESPADRDWITTPIDAFILDALKQEKLRPSQRADRATLVRRLSYNLTGLPPAPRIIERFVHDNSPNAWPRLIDEFLASPHYGEKWGQHWLDVVRFAETEGFEYDRHHAEAWRFRDYVVRSLNADKPFTQFATEQLAGDELFDSRNVDPRTNEDSLDALVAAGFHRLGPVRRNAGNPEIAFSRNEVLTEMTDAVGTVFLAMTVGCARCHDHFFDPIRQTDYYRLQSFLGGVHEYDAPLVDRETWTVWKKKHDSISEQIYEIKQTLGNVGGKEQDRLKAELIRLQEQLPQPLPSVFSVSAAENPRTPVHLLQRGDETKKLQELGMRVPGVLVPDGTQDIDADTIHPKTKLAEWITASSNPLTARVIVNRIWQYHFGRGIVATANDFGANGAEPSHPKLLDWLTRRFAESDWSLKALHRLILMSSVWQQSARSEDLQTATATDPDNRLQWHFARRRLTAEELRDSLLAVSGALNARPTGQSVMIPVDPELIKLMYKPTQWQVTENQSEHNRRTIYLIAKRNLRLPFMEVFDQPAMQTSCFRREASTHSPQALELLNGKLANRMADVFAERLKRECGNSPAMISRRAFELATGKPPSSEQQAAAVEFLERQPLREFALAVLNLNGFLYVE